MQSDIRHIRSELRAIRKRLDLLEEKTTSNAGFAKQIDELRARISKLEQISWQ